MSDEPLNPIQAQHAIDNLKAKLDKAQKALMDVQRVASMDSYLHKRAKETLVELSKMP